MHWICNLLWMIPIQHKWTGGFRQLSFSKTSYTQSSACSASSTFSWSELHLHIGQLDSVWLQSDLQLPGSQVKLSLSALLSQTSGQWTESTGQRCVHTVITRPADKCFWDIEHEQRGGSSALNFTSAVFYTGKLFHWRQTWCTNSTLRTHCKCIVSVHYIFAVTMQSTFYPSLYKQEMTQYCCWCRSIKLLLRLFIQGFNWYFIWGVSGLVLPQFFFPVTTLFHLSLVLGKRFLPKIVGQLCPSTLKNKLF